MTIATRIGSVTLRSLGTRVSSQLTRRPIHRSFASLSSTASGSRADHQTSRRRRRRGGRAIPAADDENRRILPDDPSTSIPPSQSSAFAPKDLQGNLLDSQEYLSLASLSPWVPCPDVVVKRIFEIAEAESEDVHVDLGCGDGRLNFTAMEEPHRVSRSWGVDVDPNILEKCRERLGRRFVPTSGSGHDNGNAIGGGGDRDEATRLEFFQADLKKVIEGEKEKYQMQQRLLSRDSKSEISDDAQNLSDKDEITQKLAQSTIITMYFVDDALQQLRPYLASTLGGRENARVITVGYDMKGWNASWVERVLGLTIFRYDMKDVLNEPVEWMVGEDEESKEITADGSAFKGNNNKRDALLENFNMDSNYTDVDHSDEMHEYLQQKRMQDMEELDEGLQIHHDKALDDFAEFRSKRKAREAAANSLDGGDDSGEEWEWDFDEDGDPEELMREAARTTARAKMGGRGGGMMAGLDGTGNQNDRAKKKRENMKVHQAQAKPI